MAYSNQTTHYGLPLPTGADKSTFLDTNQAFTDVDTALYAAETGISGVQSDVQDLNTAVTNLSTTVTGQATDIGALQNGLTSTNLLLQDTVSDVTELTNNSIKKTQYTETPNSNGVVAFTPDMALSRIVSVKPINSVSSTIYLDKWSCNGTTGNLYAMFTTWDSIAITDSVTFDVYYI